MLTEHYIQPSYTPVKMEPNRALSIAQCSIWFNFNAQEPIKIFGEFRFRGSFSFEYLKSRLTWFQRSHYL